jgi:hypothetical protein
MVKKIISPPLSFQGWKFGEFAKGFFGIITKLIEQNWSSSIKEALKWVVGGGASFLVVNPAYKVIIVAVAKALLDIGEFYFKEVN